MINKRKLPVGGIQTFSELRKEYAEYRDICGITQKELELYFEPEIEEAQMEAGNFGNFRDNTIALLPVFYPKIIQI